MISYQQAIAEIVRYTEPGSEFERRAIVEVADEYGDDPMYVARDVKAARVMSI